MNIDDLMWQLEAMAEEDIIFLSFETVDLIFKQSLPIKQYQCSGLMRRLNIHQYQLSDSLVRFKRQGRGE